MLMGIYVNHLEQAFNLEIEGVLSEHLIRASKSEIRWIVAKPGFWSYWRRYGDAAPEPFQNRVESLSAEVGDLVVAAQKHPAADPA
jgi:hypothetical protein